MNKYEFEPVDFNEEFTGIGWMDWYLNNLWVIGAAAGLSFVLSQNKRQNKRKHRTRMEIESDTTLTDWERDNELDMARMDGEAWD